jgi:vitamin B12 transporter
MLSFLFFVLFISAALTGALSARNADAFNETSLQNESSVQEDQAPLSDTDSPQDASLPQEGETVKKAAKSDDNRIVVKGSRKKKSSSDGTAAQSSVNSKEIEEKQSITTGDAVKEMPGVYVNGDGRTGQSQFLFVRGFRSADVLVLIDGVEIRNPLSPNGAADLSMSPENIAKIELFKGPQPVLYGSGALAGVLDIRTKKGHGRPKFTASASTAVLDMSNSRYIPDTVNASANLSGSEKRFYYSGGGSFFYTKGISMADSYKDVKENLYTKRPDNDPVIKGSVYFRGGVDIDSENTWEMIIRGNIGKADIDDGPGLGMDDPNRMLRNESLLFKTGTESNLFNKIWNLKFDVSLLLSSLRDDDPADKGKMAGDLKSRYRSLTFALNWKNSVVPAAWYELVTGVDLGTEWGTADYEDYSAGRYFNMDFVPNPDISLDAYLFNIFRPLDKLELNIGGRLQNNFYQLSLLDKESDLALPNETKKNIEPTFSVGAVYETPIELGFKARFARGAKTPTLFQRFSRYANLYQELKPETAYGFDGAVQQYFAGRKILLEAGYFYEQKHNHIDLDKSGIYSNRYRIENHGLEVSLHTKPFWGLSLRSSYTWIFKMQEYKVVEYKGKKYKAKTPTLRRPEHSFNAILNYNYDKKLNISLEVDYVGERKDEVYNYPKTPYIVTVDDFVILNFAISYRINNYVTIFAKIENMLDNDDYAYSVEYGTAGITPWIGLKLDI